MFDCAVFSLLSLHQQWESAPSHRRGSNWDPSWQPHRDDIVESDFRVHSAENFEDVWSLFEVKIGEIGMSTVSTDCGCGWFHATLSTPLVWGAVSWRIVQKRTVIKTHHSLENRGCEAKLQAFPDRWNKKGWNATFLRPSTVFDCTLEKASKRFTRFTPLILLASHHLHHVFHTTCFTAVFLWITVIFSLHPKSMKMTQMKKT